MVILSAWCETKIGEKPPLEDKSVTYGICQQCYQKMLAEWKRIRKERTMNEQMREIWTAIEGIESDLKTVQESLLVLGSRINAIERRMNADGDFMADSCSADDEDWDYRQGPEPAVQ